LSAREHDFTQSLIAWKTSNKLLAFGRKKECNAFLQVCQTRLHAMVQYAESKICRKHGEIGQKCQEQQQSKT
jgi:hypothetical protein